MKQYVKSIEFLRFFSISAVVLIHTTTRTLEASGFDLGQFSWTLFLNQIARFAVPLFFIISGYVLEVSNGDKIDYWNFIKKRFSKIFIPYVFWSLIYYYFVYNQNHDSLSKVLLTGNASYQLYFIPTLCIFYLLFPLLHKYYKVISGKLCLILLIVLELVLQSYDYYIKPFKFDDPVHIAILSFMFFIMGVVASRNKEKIYFFIHKWKYFLIPSAIISGLLVYIEGKSRYLATGNYLSFYSQWRPTVFIYTVLIGIVLFRLFDKTKFQNFMIEKFSKLSFLVFFVHVIFLERVWSIIGKPLFGFLKETAYGKIVFDLLFFLAVYSGAYIFAYVFHKISKVSKLIG